MEQQTYSFKQSIPPSKLVMVEQLINSSKFIQTFSLRYTPSKQEAEVEQCFSLKLFLLLALPFITMVQPYRYYFKNFHLF